MAHCEKPRLYSSAVQGHRAWLQANELACRAHIDARRDYDHRNRFVGEGLKGGGYTPTCRVASGSLKEPVCPCWHVACRVQIAATVGSHHGATVRGGNRLEFVGAPRTTSAPCPQAGWRTVGNHNCTTCSRDQQVNQAARVPPPPPARRQGGALWTAMLYNTADRWNGKRLDVT